MHILNIGVFFATLYSLSSQFSESCDNLDEGEQSNDRATVRIGT
jgi:hypothetical protein